METRYGVISQEILDRIWEKINIQEGCWLWDASTNHGYPRIGIGQGRLAYVHVLLYEVEHGRINLDIGHTHCYNRLCVNPSHKTLQTRSENLLDQDRLDTGDTEFFVCGHPRTSANSYSNGVTAKGTRRYSCKICKDGK